MRKTLSILLVFYSSCAIAGVENLMKYVAAGDAMANVNKPQIVKDQQGGYMTAGSIITRGATPKTLQPLLLQTPKFGLDACTGSADFRFGGLSYVSTKEFTEFLKNMATASGAYAVKMYIKSACPQCEDIMTYLETVARDINGLMMDQCSMGQMIGKGVYNTLSSSNQQQCLMQDSVGKSSRDMYEASDKCKSNPDRHGNTGHDNELKSLLGNNFNLVWKAVNTNKVGDIDFQELMMSVSGTIIGEKTGDSFKFTPKPSLITSKNMLAEYVGLDRKTGKVNLYSCDTKDKCLNPTIKTQSLEAKDTLYGNIARILDGMVPKIYNNKPQFTPEEETLISFSSIALVPLIEMEIAQKAKPEDYLVRVGEFIEVVCFDVITNFLTQVLAQVNNAVKNLEFAQTDTVVMVKFAEEVKDVRRFLNDSKFSAFKRLQMVNDYKERLTQQKLSFKHGFGKIVDNAKEE